MDNFRIKETIEKSISDHQESFSYVKTDEFYFNFNSSLKLLFETINKGGCIFTCGNGGSFADAQHFTGELIVRYKRDRKPLPSITLGCNSSNISACSNDYSYEEIFKREYQAISNKNDCLLAISTSGNSPNIQKIIRYAESNKRNWILLTSEKIKEKPIGGSIISFPYTSTAAIQECHIFTLHLLCRALEDLLFGFEY